MVDFWPDVKHDLTKVTWSHGTNSRQELSEAISGEICLDLWYLRHFWILVSQVLKRSANFLILYQDTNIMMIEADVSMGRLSSNPFEGPLIPVMAHPPLTISDLSLIDFVTTVVQV